MWMGRHAPTVSRYHQAQPRIANNSTNTELFERFVADLVLRCRNEGGQFSQLHGDFHVTLFAQDVHGHVCVVPAQ
jgi:hypothetical protein